MFSFTFCDSFILCAISIFALFLSWKKRFFNPGAKVKIKFLYRHIFYGLKCEMIIKKLSSPNYPPPIFVIVIIVLWAWSSAFFFAVSYSLKVYCDVFVWSIAEYSFSLHIMNRLNEELWL